MLVGACANQDSALVCTRRPGSVVLVTVTTSGACTKVVYAQSVDLQNQSNCNLRYCSTVCIPSQPSVGYSTREAKLNYVMQEKRELQAH